MKINILGAKWNIEYRNADADPGLDGGVDTLIHQQI